MSRKTRVPLGAPGKHHKRPRAWHRNGYYGNGRRVDKILARLEAAAKRHGGEARDA